MPKFKLRAVSNHIYCSSSMDHFVSVFFLVNGNRVARDYWFEGNHLIQADTPFEYRIPLYFAQEIHAAIVEMLKGEPKVYEFDRDGNKRYENLRYHPDGWIQSRLKMMEK